MDWRSFLKKWFDTPSFLVGDKVIVWTANPSLAQLQIKGVVTKSSFQSFGWDYYVEFTKPTKLGTFERTGWWLNDRCLTIPYVQDLLNWDK